MAQRKRVGLIFSYDEKWIAGTYYILNIVHALNSIDDSEKPALIILTESIDNYRSLQNETGYPYLEFCRYPFIKRHYSFVEKVINKCGVVFFNKRIINKLPIEPPLDFIYPKYLKGLTENLKKINWIPDFQEDHLPHFFSKEEIERRKSKQKNIIAKGDLVVLSSANSEADYKRLYPHAKAQPFILRFAVTHPDYSFESIDSLRAKYALPIDYFFAPNQFWAHKNHIVILKAIKILNKLGIKIVVAMSGNENDYRNKTNINDLKNYILQHHLEAQIKFLGFLPRTEQLCLFKHSRAIVQPSLFEGWSTVVEDAKALGKFCIVSNIAVHKEQLKENAYFFDPYDPMELAQAIKKFVKSNPDLTAIDYRMNIFNFGNKIVELIKLGV